MALGVVMGDIESMASYVFCATAGVFLYVALVDMVPELNSGHAHPFSDSHQTDPFCFELSLQLAGMLTGIAIMLAIGLYEHELSEILAA